MLLLEQRKAEKNAQREKKIVRNSFERTDVPPEEKETGIDRVRCGVGHDRLSFIDE
jgi:hypothetical protein